MKYLSVIMICALLACSLSCDDDDYNNGGGNDDGVSLNLVAEGLNSPVALIESPDNSGRLFLVDQTGQIYIIKDGERMATPFLDISDKLVPMEEGGDERGLLGLAFHPE